MGYIIALLIGVAIGIVVMATLGTASAADDWSEAYWRGFRHGQEQERLHNAITDLKKRID